MKALGLDLGTTSLSAVVLETNSGVLAAKTVQNAAFLPGERWERTQNAEEIYAAALPLVQELVCEHPEICAIGVTGQMHGIVYLDTDGRCLSPLYTWQDERAALPFNETESWAAHLSAVTSYPAAPGYGLATHYYNVHHGLVPDGGIDRNLERAGSKICVFGYLRQKVGRKSGFFCRVFVKAAVLQIKQPEACRV